MSSSDDDIEVIRDAVRGLCRRFDDDYWAACEAEHRFPTSSTTRWPRGGWIGIAIPERYGGGGQGIREAAAVLEEVAASGACMNGASAVHLSIFGMHPVVVHGSEEMKQRFLPPVADGSLHVAFGVTEPDAGTDTTRITTRPSATATSTSSTGARCGRRRRSRPTASCCSPARRRSTSANGRRRA